jgi:hypothetical protein
VDADPFAGAADAMGAEERRRRIVTTPASTIRSEAVRWLWRGYLPLRALTLVAGEPGQGKSILTGAWLAARVTRGLLDGDLYGERRDVLIASAEDDWSSVIKPRLMAHGATLPRVHRVGVRAPDGDTLLTLPDDVAMLAAEVERRRAEGAPVAVLVVDPVGAFLSGAVDSHRDASTRRAFGPLAELAMAHDLVVLGVVHLNKDETQRLVARVGGSVAFHGAPRSVLAMVRDPDDDAGEQGHERVIVHAKSNWGDYAPSLAARTEGREVETDDGRTTDAGYLRMLGESAWTVDRLQEHGRRRAGGSGDDVEAAILAAVAGGPRPSLDVKAEVIEDADVSESTVKRAAKRLHGRGRLVIERAGFPSVTHWRLASEVTVGPEPWTDPTAPTGAEGAVSAVSSVQGTRPDRDPTGDGPPGAQLPLGADDATSTPSVADHLAGMAEANRTRSWTVPDDRDDDPDDSWRQR